MKDNLTLKIISRELKIAHITIKIPLIGKVYDAVIQKSIQKVNEDKWILNINSTDHPDVPLVDGVRRI